MVIRWILIKESIQGGFSSSEGKFGEPILDKKALMIVIIGFIMWVAIILSAFGSFDRLLYIEYSVYRKNWEQDGKPFGFFWSPHEVKGADFRNFLQHSSAHRRVRFDWLFMTPSWVRGDIEARFWLYAWRALFTLSVGFILTPVLVSIIY